MSVQLKKWPDTAQLEERITSSNNIIAKFEKTTIIKDEIKLRISGNQLNLLYSTESESEKQSNLPRNGFLSLLTFLTLEVGSFLMKTRYGLG